MFIDENVFQFQTVEYLYYIHKNTYNLKTIKFILASQIIIGTININILFDKNYCK